MDSQLTLLKQICSLPTAPFAESAVIAFVKKFVAARKKLTLESDAFGNQLISLKSPSNLPRWVFTAHMDHPGFVAEKMLDAKTLRAHFRGWVKVEYVAGTKVRFFHGKKEITGKVIDCQVEDYDARAVPSSVTIRISAAVPPGSVGMFDQGVGRIAGKKFRSRACDDLAGLAAALAMLDELHAAKTPPPSPIAVLLTRAEEEGFIGCIATCENKTLLRDTDRVIAIETSSEQPAAPQGAGVIIRVGDRASIFNSALTYFLNTQAEALAKADKKFKSQRALMPGGVCEATVYDLWGHTAASLCVALGNYHNMDITKQKIAPEFIDVADWQNMVKLFVRLAQTGQDFDGTHSPLKARILGRYDRLKSLL